MPDWMRPRIALSDSVAGPMVQTILVRRIFSLYTSGNRNQSTGSLSASLRSPSRGREPSGRGQFHRRPEAPFGRDAIDLWYAAPLHTLETARLVHRALNPLPVCRALEPSPSESPPPSPSPGPACPGAQLAPRRRNSLQAELHE